MTKSEEKTIRNVIEIFEANHIPSNKRSWEVHTCAARLMVADYDGSLTANPEPWTELTIEEYEGYANGRQVTRSISMTLKGECRDALIAMLSRKPQPMGDRKGRPHPQAHFISVAEESAED